MCPPGRRRGSQPTTRWGDPFLGLAQFDLTVASVSLLTCPSPGCDGGQVSVTTELSGPPGAQTAVRGGAPRSRPRAPNSRRRCRVDPAGRRALRAEPAGTEFPAAWSVPTFAAESPAPPRHLDLVTASGRAGCSRMLAPPDRSVSAAGHQGPRAPPWKTPASRSEKPTALTSVRSRTPSLPPLQARVASAGLRSEPAARSRGAGALAAWQRMFLRSVRGEEQGLTSTDKKSDLSLPCHP